MNDLNTNMFLRQNQIQQQAQTNKVDEKVDEQNQQNQSALSQEESSSPQETFSERGTELLNTMDYIAKATCTPKKVVQKNPAQINATKQNSTTNALNVLKALNVTGKISNATFSTSGNLQTFTLNGKTYKVNYLNTTDASGNLRIKNIKCGNTYYTVSYDSKGNLRNVRDNKGVHTIKSDTTVSVQAGSSSSGSSSTTAASGSSGATSTAGTQGAENNSSSGASGSSAATNTTGTQATDSAQQITLINSELAESSLKAVLKAIINPNIDNYEKVLANAPDNATITGQTSSGRVSKFIYNDIEYTINYQTISTAKDKDGNLKIKNIVHTDSQGKKHTYVVNYSNNAIISNVTENGKKLYAFNANGTAAIGKLSSSEQVLQGQSLMMASLAIGIPSDEEIIAANNFDANTDLSDMKINNRAGYLDAIRVTIADILGEDASNFPARNSDAYALKFTQAFLKKGGEIESNAKSGRIEKITYGEHEYKINYNSKPTDKLNPDGSKIWTTEMDAEGNAQMKNILIDGGKKPEDVLLFSYYYGGEDTKHGILSYVYHHIYDEKGKIKLKEGVEDTTANRAIESNWEKVIDRQFVVRN